MNMQDASPPPIQRLLILHLNLALLCTGKVLSESASTEEWQEHILYYHQENSSVGSSSVPEINHAAIQFASLCIALVNLPSVLRSTGNKNDENENSNDQMCEVQLDKSMLVFIPLESEMHGTPQIVAVAQINKSGTGNSKGCNPLAIRASVERWHKLFCLLRYGGIHYRLSRLLSKPSELNPSTDAAFAETHECPYPGMDHLFDRLKALRSLREAMYRSSESDFNQQEEESQLVAEIKSLRNTLPMASLGEDLKFHYDAYLGDLANATERHSGAGRCVVETIPAPIARSEDHNPSEWAPGCPPPHVSFHLGRAISMLLSTSSMDNNSQFFAVSTFYQGQLLFHHQGDGHFEEQNSSASLLMWYFASYSTKMKQQKQNQETFAASSPPRRISRGLVSFSDHVSVTSGVESVDHGVPLETADEQSPGHFLQTPPLAMLSASEQNTTSVRGPSNELVWAPLVCCKRGDEEGFVIVHGIVYEWNDFSFLLYIHPTEETPENLGPDNSAASDEESQEGRETLLENISTTLHHCLSLHTDDPVAVKSNGMASSFMPESQRMILSSSGRDLIFVDRKSQVMLLFPRQAPKQPNRSTSRSPRRFMNVFRPAIPDIQEENKSANHDLMNWASEGLDCRHWLASHLSPEALSAFDDVMNDVDSHKHKSRTSNAIDRRTCNGAMGGGNYEMLTAISGGWMYALADEQDQEIYILFDSKEYATIRDVQNAIVNVRGALSYDSTPTVPS